MKASFHISEGDKGQAIMSIELTVTNELDAALLKKASTMKSGGVNIQRENLTILFYEPTGGQINGGQG